MNVFEPYGTFYETPYREMGFRDDQWEEVTSGDKRLIRDWIFNGYNDLQVVIYDDYRDDTRIRMLRQKYSLDERPKIHINWTSFRFY